MFRFLALRPHSDRGLPVQVPLHRYCRSTRRHCVHIRVLQKSFRRIPQEREDHTQKPPSTRQRTREKPIVPSDVSYSLYETSTFYSSWVCESTRSQTGGDLTRRGDAASNASCESPSPQIYGFLRTMLRNS